MPITYTIDHARRLVHARGCGTFSAADMFAYQREVWTRPDVAGYDELVDMSGVNDIAISFPSDTPARVLAAESAAMDPQQTTAKFAIVAPDDLSFGLGRMYQTYRQLEPRSTKQVEVFRTLADALLFLGIEGPVDRRANVLPTEPLR